jgi:hypothetical protein
MGVRKPFKIQLLTFLIFISVFMGMHFKMQGHSLSFDTSVVVSNSYENSKRNAFQVDVSLYGAKDMHAGMVVFEYNPDVLSPVGDISYGGLLQEFLVSDRLVHEKGEIRVAWAGGKGVSKDGVLFSIPFQLKMDRGVSPLRLTRVDLYNAQGEAIMVNRLHGRVGAFEGKTTLHKTEVSHNKAFRIRFSHALRASTVNIKTIGVFGKDSGKPVEVEVHLIDSQTVQIKPVGAYVPGAYDLIITDRIRSQRGKIMKQGMQMEFVVF